MKRRPLLLGALALGAAHAARALDAPAGEPLLIIGGNVKMPNRGAQAVFDLAMLQRLPRGEVNAKTPWYSTARSFSGPLLREVLAAAGARGARLQATALNDYRVEIPFDDVLRYDVLLATQLDGKPMPVRDKGPLFIMYPFERHPELRTPVFFSRCAWQVNRLDVS